MRRRCSGDTAYTGAKRWRAVGVALTLPPSKWSLVCAGVAAGKSNGQIARETGIARRVVAVYAWKYRTSAVSMAVG